MNGENFGGDGDLKNKVDVVQSSLLVLIIVTTIFIGGLTPVVQRILLPKPVEADPQHGPKDRGVSVNQGDQDDDSVEVDLSTNLMKQSSALMPEDMTMKSHYNEFVHPNLEEEEEVVDDDGTLQKVAKRRGCFDRFNDFDDLWLRPCCIYKYGRIKKRANFEFADILDEYEAIQEELNNGNDSDEDEGADGDRSKTINRLLMERSGRFES